MARARDTIRRGSQSFAGASLLLDQQAREDAWALYTWCRYCDDYVDGQQLGGPTVNDATACGAMLTEIRQLTRLALATDELVPEAFQMLRRVARTRALSHNAALQLLEGFAMDVQGRQYATIADTLDYAYHVAGVVGVMMAQVMGVHERSTLERASDLGIGFQLTNIARDVMDDARAGRVYLPADWLAAEGIGPTPEAVLANPAAVARVVKRLLNGAEGYYRSARTGVGRLPLRRAWAIAAARDVYRDIGREVLRRGPQAWTQRVSISPTRKLLLVGRAALVALGTRVSISPSPRDGLHAFPG